MGDTGSQFLGFSAGTLSVMLTQHANMALSPVLPLLLLGLPILDTLAVMTQRIYEGRSPFSPDKNHIHHKLLALGFDHYEAVSMIYLAVAILVSSAYILRYQSDGLILVSYLGFCVVVLTFFHLANKFRWRIHHATGNGGSLFSGSIQRLRLSGWLQKGPRGVLGITIPVILLLSAIIPGKVPPDIATASAMLIAVLGFVLLRWHDPQHVGARACIYVTAAFAVYMIESTSIGLGGGQYLDYLFYALALVVAISLRFSERRTFRITPLDLLVLLIALVVPILPDSTGLGVDPKSLVIKLIILFYSCELLITGKVRTANMLNIAALLTLGIFVVRGLVP
jgi:UDP-GlcNAc:undecaprenyl-phosphate GlcNAc-1-phosphate transferase